MDHHYYETHLEEYRKKRLQRYKANSGKIREKVRCYREANPEKIKESRLRYTKNNSEKIKKNALAWRKANSEKLKMCRCITRKKWYGMPQNRLNVNVGTGIRKSLKGNKKGDHWEILVDYTIEQLKKHLEKRFLTGMNWENYGKWHIDHRIPISVFNFETEKDLDFKRCWALENLQPMWAIDNVKKNDKIDKPFQPALRLSV